MLPPLSTLWKGRENMEEIWKDVEGYDGKYQVSNIGRVKSLWDRGVKREKILSLQNHDAGYLRIVLSKDGIAKLYLVHRLVAEAFIDNPNNYEFVNHKDEDKKNNSVENLEWCTKSYNTIYYLNKKPERKIEYAKRLRDKKTNELLSRYTKKNLAHTNTRSVVQKSLDGNIIEVFDNAIEAFKKTGITPRYITVACKKNESGRPKLHKRISDKYVSHGFIWEYLPE